MPQKFIVLGMSGSAALAVINDNCTELYNSISTPIKLPGQTANFQVNIPANTKITEIDMSAVVNNPTIRIGTTPNGQELMEDTVIGNSFSVNEAFYAQGATIIYFTFTGIGAINVRIGAINNFY